MARRAWLITFVALLLPILLGSTPPTQTTELFLSPINEEPRTESTPLPNFPEPGAVIPLSKAVPNLSIVTPKEVPEEVELIPPTPAPPPSTEEFEETVIGYGDPCDILAYEDLFLHQIRIGELEPVMAMSTQEYDFGEERGKVLFKDFLKELCIEVSKNKVVDIFKYDCYPNEDNNTLGHCYCGLEIAKVDFRIPQLPEIPATMKQYNSIYTLNKRPVLEDGKCVSGNDGHCTLLENEQQRLKDGAELIKCRKEYVCDQPRLLKLHNKYNNEGYGFCNKNEAKLIDLDGSACMVSCGCLNVLLTISIWLVILR